MSYPIIDLPFAGRTAADWCSLRTRSVMAAMGEYSGGLTAWYDAAVAAVNAIVFDDNVPWGQCYYLDYGGGSGPTPTGSPLTSSLIAVTDARVNLGLAALPGYSASPSLQSQNTAPSGANPSFFFIQKTQIITPKPWFIAYQDAESSGFYTGLPTYLTHDSLTAISYDPNYPAPPTSGNVSFCQPASRLVELPVPQFYGRYTCFPSQNMRPSGATYDGDGNYYLTGFMGNSSDPLINGLTSPQPSYYWHQGVNDFTAPGLTASGYFTASPDGSTGITFTGTPNARVTFYCYYANAG